MTFDPNTTVRPRSRRRRWLRRVLVAGATLGVVLLAAYVFVLPRIAHSVLAGVLERAGLPGTRFEVRRVTPFRATVTHLATPAGDLRVASLNVTYGLRGLMSGNVDRIAIRGVEVRLELGEDGVVTPFPSGKASTAPPTSAPTSQPQPTGGGKPLRLPFRSLDLSSSAVTLAWNRQTLRFRVNGAINNADPANASGDVTVRLEAPAKGVSLPGSAKLHSPSGVLSFVASIEGSMRTGVDGSAWNASLSASNPTPARLVTPDVDADLGRFRLEGRVSGGSNLAGASGLKGTSVDARLNIEGAAMKHAASKLTLAGISAEVPLTMNRGDAASRGPGRIAFNSVTLGDEKLEPLDATLAVHDGRASFSAAWAVAPPDGVLSANGWVERWGSGIVGGFAAQLPRTRIGDAGLLARRAPAMRGWDVTGTIGFDADVTLAAGGTRGRAKLVIDGAEAAAKESGVELHGISGEAVVDVAPGWTLTTPGTQRLSVSRGAFATIELTDALLALRLDREPKALLIEQLSAGWLGGRISTANVRLDPAKPKFEAILAADDISLKEFLEFAAPGRARGEGRLAGRVAMRFDGPGDVTFGPGILRSQSPTGAVQVLDTKWLGETIDQSDPRFTSDPQHRQVRQRILEALADFSYDRLTFSFAEEPASRGLLQVSTHGKGRVGRHPQELDFTLNIRGVNDLVKYGLGGKRGYDRLTNPGN